MSLMENIGGALGISAGQGLMQQAFNQNATQQQIAGSKELALYNNQLAYDMWKKTNYSAQVKELQKAGLNVGLMYKGAGAGGGTLGNASGNVSQGQNKIDMIGGMQMMLQSKLQEAEIKKIEAETKEVEARTPTYSKGIEKTDNEIKEIASRVGVNEEQVRKIIQDIEASKTGQKVQEATIPKIEAEVKNIESQTNRIKTLTPLEANNIKENTKSQITKNVYLDRKERAELDNLLQDILNKRNQIKQSLNDIEIKKFSEEMKADYPSLFNVGGRAVDGIMKVMEKLLGTSGNVQRKINTE